LFPVNHSGDTIRFRYAFVDCLYTGALTVTTAATVHSGPFYHVAATVTAPTSITGATTARVTHRYLPQGKEKKRKKEGKERKGYARYSSPHRFYRSRYSAALPRFHLFFWLRAASFRHGSHTLSLV